MMRKLCRLVMFLFLLSQLTVPVYAYSWRDMEDNAQDLKLGEEVSCYIDDSDEEDAQDFRIAMTGSGAMTIKFEARAYKTFFAVYDDNGKKIKLTDIEVNAGRKVSGGINSSSSIGFQWNDKVKKSSGTITYGNLSKGTYYIKVYGSNEYDYYDEYGDVTFTVSRSIDRGASDSSSAGSDVDTKFSVYVTLKKGKTLQLGASVKNTGYETPTWKSSNSKIATVSQTGLVKGIKKGSVTITASLAGQKQSIYIVVTD